MALRGPLVEQKGTWKPLGHTNRLMETWGFMEGHQRLLGQTERPLRPIERLVEKFTHLELMDNPLVPNNQILVVSLLEKHRHFHTEAATAPWDSPGSPAAHPSCSHL